MQAFIFVASTHWVVILSTLNHEILTPEVIVVEIPLA